jgi:hypothetical protein
LGLFTLADIRAHVQFGCAFHRRCVFNIIFSVKNPKITSKTLATVKGTVYEYTQLRQCHRAYVIEQTFAVILHREAISASCRLYFLGPFKEK